MRWHTWADVARVLRDFLGPNAFFFGLLIPAYLIANYFAGGALSAAVREIDAEQWQLAGVVFIVPTLFLAWRTLRQNRRIAILNTRAGVIQHCAGRYDELYRERPQVTPETAHDYLSRYWGLKSDQVDFYLAGWVDVDTLRSWIYSTCLAFIRNPRFGGVSVRESWTGDARAYHSVVNTIFSQMNDAILEVVSEAPAGDPGLLAQAITDELLHQLESSTAREREMVQRRYSVREYLGRLRDKKYFSATKLREAAGQRPKFNLLRKSAPQARP